MSNRHACVHIRRSFWPVSNGRFFDTGVYFFAPFNVAEAVFVHLYVRGFSTGSSSLIGLNLHCHVGEEFDRKFLSGLFRLSAGFIPAAYSCSSSFLISRCVEIAVTLVIAVFLPASDILGIRDLSLILGILDRLWLIAVFSVVTLARVSSVSSSSSSPMLRKSIVGPPYSSLALDLVGDSLSLIGSVGKSNTDPSSSELSLLVGVSR